MARRSVELLFAGDANYDRRSIFQIDERIEIFRAGQIRKVDDIVSHLGDFASHFSPDRQCNPTDLAALP
jgi:hypothetical protein